MLKQLQLKNFKAWKELDIHFSQVTALFGANNSGKSSLIQFLLMLKQTKEATGSGVVLNLNHAPTFVDLGTYENLIYQHQAQLPLSWVIDWKPTNHSTYIQTQASVNLAQQQLQLRSLGYKTTHTSFELNLNSRGHFDFIQNEKFIKQVLHPVKTHLFPNESQIDLVSNFLRVFEFEYEQMMDGIYYLSALREPVKREYQWFSSNPVGVGFRGEWCMEAILSATICNEMRLLNDKLEPFSVIISYWLKKLGLVDQFSIKEMAPHSNLYRPLVKKTNNSTEFFLTDVGLSVSQVLPVLVLLYYVPEESTVLIDQPEIYLHPSIHSGLADIILNVSKQRNIQVIIESHSEHLLRRFQGRVAEKSYSVDDLKLYVCRNNDKESSVTDLNINELGEIEQWPNHFFNE
ncbi:MAG: AAA family ATPase [Methylococcales bacterium]|nr:AAA family ATPase [Methylococcales bacterium]